MALIYINVMPLLPWLLNCVLPLCLSISGLDPILFFYKGGGLVACKSDNKKIMHLFEIKPIIAGKMAKILKHFIPHAANLQ